MYVQSDRLRRSKRILEPNSLAGFPAAVNVGTSAGAGAGPVAVAGAGTGAVAFGCIRVEKLERTGVVVEPAREADRVIAADDDPGLRPRGRCGISAYVDGVGGWDDVLVRRRLVARAPGPVIEEEVVGLRLLRVDVVEAVFDFCLGVGLLVKGFWDG